MRLFGYSLGVAALLVPAIASAQPTTTTTTVQPAPQPAPTTTTTTVQTQPAPQPTAPVVVVPPQQAAPPPTTVISTQSGDADVVRDPLNAPVFATGAVVFGGTYLASVLVAGSSSEKGGHHHLYVPLAGPWLDLADRPSCDPTNTACDHETTTKVLLVADGVFQAAGVLTMLDGVLDPSRRSRAAVVADKKVHVTPTTFAGTGGGLNVFGNF